MKTILRNLQRLKSVWAKNLLKISKTSLFLSAHPFLVLGPKPLPRPISTHASPNSCPHTWALAQLSKPSQTSRPPPPPFSSTGRWAPLPLSPTGGPHVSPPTSSRPESSLPSLHQWRNQTPIDAFSFTPALIPSPISAPPLLPLFTLSRSIYGLKAIIALTIGHHSTELQSHPLLLPPPLYKPTRSMRAYASASLPLVVPPLLLHCHHCRPEIELVDLPRC